MEEGAFIWFWLLVAILLLSFCICTTSVICCCCESRQDNAGLRFPCFGPCCTISNQVNGPNRQGSMDAAASGFGSEISHQRNRSPSDTLSSLKTERARACLTNCKIIKCSNQRLAAKFGLALKWENERCTICLEIYDYGDLIAVCPCKHCYHLTCLEGWLRMKRSCPLCKKIIAGDEVTENSPLLFAPV